MPAKACAFADIEKVKLVAATSAASASFQKLTSVRSGFGCVCVRFAIWVHPGEVTAVVVGPQ